MLSSGQFSGYVIFLKLPRIVWLSIIQRFRTYNLPLGTASPEAIAWMKLMWSDSMLMTLAKDYFRQAEDPKTTIAKYDDKFKGNPDVQYGRFEQDWEFVAST